MRPSWRRKLYIPPEKGRIESNDPPAAAYMGDRYPVDIIESGGLVGLPKERNELENGEEEFWEQDRDWRG